MRSERRTIPVVTYSPFEKSSKETLTIRSLRNIVQQYLPSGVIVDPFARNCRLGTLRNDVNPDTDADFHLDALDFQDLLIQRGIVADAVILDPPFTDKQASEYGTPGDVTRLYTGSKNRLTQILKVGGIAVTCGFTSTGFSAERGFEKLHVHHVCHGGLAFDTAIVVERKVRNIQPRQLA